MGRGLLGLAFAAIAWSAVNGAPQLQAAPGDPMASDMLSRSLAEAEQREGGQSPSLLPLLDRLARAQFREGRLDRQVETRRRALAIAVRNFGGGSAQAAEAMTALAQAYIDRRRYLDAEPLLISANIVLAGRQTPSDAALAAVLAARARVALAGGEAPLAQKWAERAVGAVPDAAERRSGEPVLALAAAFAAQERFAKADKLLREALARERAGNAGNDHFALARTLSQFANLYLRQKRFSEALPLLAEASALDQAALAPGHPLIADDFADLGLVYEGLHRNDEARAALDFAIKLLRGASEKNTPRLAYVELEQARILRAQGKDEAADALYAEAQRILNRAEDEERERERRV